MAFETFTLPQILDDLISRFIINVPEEELSSIQRIYFQIEQAHWFYLDFIKPVTSHPAYTLKNFSLVIFKHCVLLNHYVASHAKVFAEFMAYKTKVPVCGGILLNETLDKVLLVRGWKASSTWTFPRGKINKNEPETVCSVREIFEETGFDCTSFLRQNEYIERNLSEQRQRLYIITGVPEETEFITQTRQEIGDIKWFHISKLSSEQVKTYQVIPFEKAILKWIQRFKKARKQGKVRGMAHLKVDADDDVENIVVQDKIVEQDMEPEIYPNEYVHSKSDITFMESSLKSILGITREHSSTGFVDPALVSVEIIPAPTFATKKKRNRSKKIAPGIVLLPESADNQMNVDLPSPKTSELSESVLPIEKLQLLDVLLRRTSVIVPPPSPPILKRGSLPNLSADKMGLLNMLISGTNDKLNTELPHVSAAVDVVEKSTARTNEKDELLAMLLGGKKSTKLEEKAEFVEPKSFFPIEKAELVDILFNKAKPLPNIPIIVAAAGMDYEMESVEQLKEKHKRKQQSEGQVVDKSSLDTRGTVSISAGAKRQKPGNAKASAVARTDAAIIKVPVFTKILQRPPKLPILAAEMKIPQTFKPSGSPKMNLSPSLKKADTPSESIRKFTKILQRPKPSDIDPLRQEMAVTAMEALTLPTVKTKILKPTRTNSVLLDVLFGNQSSKVEAAALNIVLPLDQQSLLGILTTSPVLASPVVKDEGPIIETSQTQKTNSHKSGLLNLLLKGNDGHSVNIQTPLEAIPSQRTNSNKSSLLNLLLKGNNEGQSVEPQRKRSSFLSLFGILKPATSIPASQTGLSPTISLLDIHHPQHQSGSIFQRAIPKPSKRISIDECVDEDTDMC